MLYLLAKFLTHYLHSFHIFHYLTFRAILSALTSFVLSLSLGPWMIRRLQQLQMGQVVRDDGPQSHLSKAGTPTMGGILIILTVFLSSVLWGNVTNVYLWCSVLVMLGYALIGWVDDYRKVAKKNSKGMSAKQKMLLQSIFAIVAVVYLYLHVPGSAMTHLIIPYTKSTELYLGWGMVVLAFFVIVGSSNAVNLTDGLDGLAILPTVLVAAALGVFAYVTGNYNFAHYLTIPFIPGVGECLIVTSAIVGAGLGFLWFNAYPAQVFMGDVGSLGLGAVLGAIAVIVRQELVLFIMGGIFVLETVSVILQVGSYKTRGKRIFKMAPIHHHFELKGWPEPKVIVRFWIITFVLVLLGLASLKIR